MANLTCPNCGGNQVNNWSLPDRLVRMECMDCGHDTGDIWLRDDEDADVVLRAFVTASRRAYASLDDMRQVLSQQVGCHQ